MNGVCLQFYMGEFQKHHGILVHEWILELAKKNGIGGGSAFRAIAGYGHHGIIHEEHFFELASDVPISVTFFTPKETALNLIKLIKSENINLFYVILNAEYGSLNEDQQAK